MKPFRQGDVLIIPGWSTSKDPDQIKSDLILFEGEATGHKHQISQGEVELFDGGGGILYLKVLSELALLIHEEHESIWIPQGAWTVRRQRGYEPEGWRYMTD